jgi:hypothetical protein
MRLEYLATLNDEQQAADYKLFPVELAQVESRTGAVTWAMRQRPHHLRSPALPSLDARTTLSESRQGHRRSATLSSLPSPMTGLPRLLESPFRRAVPTTPAD